MTGLSIADLPRPPISYRCDRLRVEAPRSFETLARARAEDTFRVTRLMRSAATLATVSTPQALRLARRLQHSLARLKVPVTMASSRWMRKRRIQVCSELWQLYDKADPAKFKTVTLIPRGWRFTADEIAAVDPRKLLKAVRMDLMRAGASSVAGYLIAFIHGEFDPATELFQLHLHGVVAGGMIDVVKQ